MKTGGIILVVLGVLNFIRAILAFSNDANGGSALTAGIAFVAIGAYLIYRSGQKQIEKEAEKNDDWDETK